AVVARRRRAGGGARLGGGGRQRWGGVGGASRSLRANPNRKSIPLASHQAIRSSRANQEQVDQEILDRHRIVADLVIARRRKPNPLTGCRDIRDVFDRCIPTIALLIRWGELDRP